MKQRKHQDTDLAQWIGPGRALGFGTLVAPAKKRWIARVMLFNAMAKTLPQELHELRKSTIDLYSELTEMARKATGDEGLQMPCLTMLRSEEVAGNIETKTWAETVTTWLSLQTVASDYAAAGRLRDEIYAWVTARNMDVEWFRDVVLGNVMIWYITREHDLPADETWSQPGSLQWGPHRKSGGAGHIPGEWGPEHFLQPPSLPPYNPAKQTREHHRQLVKVVLDEYHNHQETIYKNAGFVPVVLKRASKPIGDPWVEYTWFVRYQLQGWTRGRILESDPSFNGRGEDTIYRAVSTVAKLLEVPLRPLPAVLGNKKNSLKS